MICQVSSLVLNRPRQSAGRVAEKQHRQSQRIAGQNNLSEGQGFNHDLTQAVDHAKSSHSCKQQEDTLQFIIHAPTLNGVG